MYYEPLAHSPRFMIASDCAHGERGGDLMYFAMDEIGLDNVSRLSLMDDMDRV
ncbi:MAG: hypothetical protein ACM3WU_05435 [Bacillota bacterium]